MGQVCDGAELGRSEDLRAERLGEVSTELGLGVPRELCRWHQGSRGEGFCRCAWGPPGRPGHKGAGCSAQTMLGWPEVWEVLFLPLVGGER